MTLSVVVSTYNSPRYLSLVLEGLSLQTDAAFECIVADDGSGPETAVVIDAARPRLPVIHSWQADAGFRLAASRNRALTRASGDWVAFLDGDCIPSPDYVADVKAIADRRLARTTRFYVQGHRVILGEELSRSITGATGIFSPTWLLAHRKELSNFANGLRPAILPLWPKKNLRGVRGCNMIFRADDLRAVNGFDEEFVGWGHEDRDIVSRLFRSGVFRVDARGRAIVYHLYHPEQSRAAASENLDRAAEERPVRARKGIGA